MRSTDSYLLEWLFMLGKYLAKEFKSGRLHFYYEDNQIKLEHPVFNFGFNTTILKDKSIANP